MKRSKKEIREAASSLGLWSVGAELFRLGVEYADEHPCRRVTREEVQEYCSKVSHEWWEQAMSRWNSMDEKEAEKYNQFIGFNDFSDHLMNIMADALNQLEKTGKLEYKEGKKLCY